MDLDCGSGETEAAGLGMNLQPAAVPLHNVIVADDAFMGEATDAFEVFRSRAPGVGCVAGSASEAAVVVGDEASQDAVGRVQIVGLGQAEFAGEAILKHAPKAFDAAFGLRALGGDEGDAELLERATELRGLALAGTAMDANQLCLEACGYRAEDVLGKPFGETGWWRLSPEAQDKIRVATAQAAHGTAYRDTLTYHWSDGTARLVDFSLHPIRDHEGRIFFLHPTGVDITDLKRAEEKYRSLAETLDAEVRARTSEVVRQSEQLRDLSSRLLQAQDEERRHIARELHDSAGQILAVLGMSLTMVSRHSSRGGPELAKYTEQSQELVGQLSQEIRTMSYLLHPPLLEEMGLAEALRWYIQGLAERSGMQIILEIPEDFERPSRELELVLFRVVQECLTNIHRHSGSKSAVVRFAREEGGIFLVVQDSGKGIPAEKLSEIQSHGSGVGIRGMRERVRHFGGHMQIESNPGATKVSFRFPLASIPASRPEVISDRENAAG
jgi:PAS domain S-box-containing protein